MIDFFHHALGKDRTMKVSAVDQMQLQFFLVSSLNVSRFELCGMIISLSGAVWMISRAQCVKTSKSGLSPAETMLSISSIQ